MKFLVIGAIVAVTTGCTMMPYDKDNPDEYYKYWSKEENKKDSFLYDYTREAEMERNGTAPRRPPGFY